jgi:hypothetical protein
MEYLQDLDRITALAAALVGVTEAVAVVKHSPVVLVVVEQQQVQFLLEALEYLVKETMVVLVEEMQAVEVGRVALW